MFRCFLVISLMSLVVSTSAFSQETKLEPTSRLESGYVLAVPLTSGNLQIQVCNPDCTVLGQPEGYSPQWLTSRSHQLNRRAYELAATDVVAIPLATCAGIFAGMAAFSTSPAWGPASAAALFVGTHWVVDTTVGLAIGFGGSTAAALRFFNPWISKRAAKALNVDQLQSGQEVVFEGTFADFVKSLKYALEIKN